MRERSRADLGGLAGPSCVPAGGQGAHCVDICVLSGAGCPTGCCKGERGTGGHRLAGEERNLWLQRWAPSTGLCLVHSAWRPSLRIPSSKAQCAGPTAAPKAPGAARAGRAGAPCVSEQRRGAPRHGRHNLAALSCTAKARCGHSSAWGLLTLRVWCRGACWAADCTPAVCRVDAGVGMCVASPRERHDEAAWTASAPPPFGVPSADRRQSARIARTRRSCWRPPPGLPLLPGTS